MLPMSKALEEDDVLEPFLSVLMLLCQRLSNLRSDWALTGSLAFQLRGMDVSVHDVDIQTDSPGAYEIEQRLQEFVVDPVRFKTSPRIRSHFGRLEIAGIRVEIMGDIEKWTPSGMWIPAPLLSPIIETVLYEGLSIPVLTLAYEQQAYEQMGRSDTTTALLRWMSEERNES